jgi:MFS family permease
VLLVRSPYPIRHIPLLFSGANALICLLVAEAGLYPGIAYYITLWYPRHLAQYRQAMFFSAASVAGAFSGILAWAIAVRSLLPSSSPSV